MLLSGLITDNLQLMFESFEESAIARVGINRSIRNWITSNAINFLMILPMLTYLYKGDKRIFVKDT